MADLRKQAHERIETVRYIDLDRRRATLPQPLQPLFVVRRKWKYELVPYVGNLDALLAADKHPWRREDRHYHGRRWRLFHRNAQLLRLAAGLNIDVYCLGAVLWPTRWVFMRDPQRTEDPPRAPQLLPRRDI